MKIQSFKDIISDYDTVLLDSYGVLKNYHGIISGAEESLRNIRSLNKRYRILTNDASSSQEKLSAKFARGGITIRPHRIITSGLMTQRFLSSKQIIGKILYLGTDDSADFIVRAGHKKISVTEFSDDAYEDVGCVVFLDDEGFDMNTAINKVVNLLRKRAIPVIVANSDLIYPVARNDVSIATGAIARLVESIVGRKFIYYGKPDVQMFLYAYEDLRKDNPDLDKSKILMVGDTLHTDILGATKFGIDTVLVLSGNTSKVDADWMIKSTGISPDYICESILS